MDKNRACCSGGHCWGYHPGTLSALPSHCNSIEDQGPFQGLDQVIRYQPTHRDRVMHIYVGNQTIIGSNNGLLPGRRQTIIWTNAGILFIWILGTHCSEILSEIGTFSLTKMHLKLSSVKRRQFCLSLNVLTLPSPGNSITDCSDWMKW